MKDKCEWKEGDLHQCIDARGLFTVGENGSALQYGYTYRLLNFCPFCGADIRKPEPEVIIRKSGGTWVAKCDGVDYLWTSTKPMAGATFAHDFMSAYSYWKPISEIEITDEIAKLRPMAGIDGAFYHLYAVNEKGIAIMMKTGCHPFCIHVRNIRLATVSDLEE